MRFESQFCMKGAESSRLEYQFAHDDYYIVETISTILKFVALEHLSFVLLPTQKHS